MKANAKNLKPILTELKKNGIDKNSFAKFSNAFDNLIKIKPDEASEPNIVNTTNSFLKALGYGVTIQSFQKIKTDGCIIDKNDNTQVIIEYKKQTETKDFPNFNPDGSLNFQVKPFYQLIKYYLEHKSDNKEKEIKCLIITNGTKWFIIDIIDFKNFLIQNKKIENYYKDNRNQITEGIYNEFSEILKSSTKSINVIYFDIKENGKSKLSNEEIFLLLRKEFLLKEFDLTDSNTLNKNFYSELLHIIGLKEEKKSGKFLIVRCSENQRNYASLLENTISRLKSSGRLSKISNINDYGKDQEEQIFNISLELTITWINRLLFLKLLEAQLVKYNEDPDINDVKFLDIKNFKDFDGIYDLFFDILAIRQEERSKHITDKFQFIPYLNSSLFEPTDLEIETLHINALNDNLLLPVPNSSVIIEKQGKEYDTLEYLLEFLDRYNFSSSQDDIFLDTSTIINASVLGLIYEKLNGYKDGSFFTPGYITEYMCRETLRRAVVQKFNDKKVKTTKFENFTSVYNYCLDVKPEEKVKLNEYINEITICDPAVGSGHFLVSALNEMIAIKSELKLLLVDDEKGTRLDCSATVKNDTLQLKQDNKLFVYNKNNEESSLIQKTIFHEKQKIIEECLFGVDINPNSVKICRLRLWIELLKNTYYKGAIGDKNRELEVLPNIDINIKCGNSLISKFDLRNDNFKISDKRLLEKYRLNVATYKETYDREAKADLKKEIENAKNEFKGKWTGESKNEKKLKEKTNKLLELTNQIGFGEKTNFEKIRIQELEKGIEKYQKIVDEEKINPIFRNALEWRFEFPEVLDKEGDFIGFDVVIGNPPYIRGREFDKNYREYFKHYGTNSQDTAILFIKLSTQLVKNNVGHNCMIVPKSLLYASNFDNIRNQIKKLLKLVIDCGKVWEDVLLEQTIYLLQLTNNNSYLAGKIKNEKIITSIEINNKYIDKFNTIISTENLNELTIANKMANNGIILNDIANNIPGIPNQKYISAEGDYKMIGGAEFNRYSIHKIKGHIDKKYVNSQNAFIKNNSLIVQNIIAHITLPKEHIKITACITNLKDKEKIIIANTVNQLLIKDKYKSTYSNYFIWAILNSYVLNWYVYNFVFARAIRTMHFYNPVTEKIPIPKASKTEQQPIIDLVNQILNAKKANPDTDTTVQEKEIDQLVYKLYDLTEEEIKIVEGE